MNAMILYLLESAGCLLLLFPVYWFFLRRDTFFRVNRFFLLGMLGFSLLVPLLPVSRVPVVASSSLVILLDPVLITPAKIQQTLSGNLRWTEIATVIYLTGIFIFLLRFILQLIQLCRITRRFGIRNEYGNKLVFVDRGYSPFSFFNLVYINEEMIPVGSLHTILEHENVHIRQRHTLDMILLELAAIVQWFNPVIWLAGREMKILHEYLADEGVLKSGIGRSQYQQMILDETMGIRVNGLTNNFNVSILKKRIVMMTKSKSTNWSKSKLLFLLPALFIVWFMLTSHSYSIAITAKTAGSSVIVPEMKAAPTDTVRKNKPANINLEEQEVFVMVEQQPQYPGGDEARIKFLVENLKYPEKAMKQGIQGKVFVTFIVRKNGDITNAQVIRGIGGGCDEEALRVVNLMPKWVPGEQKGKPVDVRFNLPFNFKLPKEKPAEPQKETPK